MDKYNHWLGNFLVWINHEDQYAITLGQTAYYSCSRDPTSEHGEPME